MILSNIKGITIPEGAVKQIADGAGRVLWKAAPSSIVPGLVIGYNGDYTDQADVVMGDGKHYRLLTLTGSGTLTLDQSVKADVWLCTGGNGGRNGGGNGGGGGKFVQSDGLQLAASTVCTIGAGGSGATTDTNGRGGGTAFGSLSAAQETKYNGNGASGGGRGGRTNLAGGWPAGTGGGVTTVPFQDGSVFDPHSAGGGGGGYRDREDDEEGTGGAGGSDGANGGGRSSSGYNGGTAGERGGGAGGTGSSSTAGAGSDATFYGSGGGAGGYYVSSGGTKTSKNGGAGYQGVIYVRIPYDQ